MNLSWQIQVWYPSVAIMDACGQFHYYPVGGKARHARLAGAFDIAPHEPDSRIDGLFTMLTDKDLLLLVKTNKSIKNESDPMYYKVSRSDFDHWVKGDCTNLVEVVQDAKEEEWMGALKFNSDLQLKLQQKKKSEAFFG